MMDYVSKRESGKARSGSGNNGDGAKNPFRKGRLLPLKEAYDIATEASWKFVSPVSGYFGARDGYPEQYPGKRPDASFLYLKRGDSEPAAHIMAFEDQRDPYSAQVFIPGSGFVRVSEILADMKAPRMEDMYLLIGYGSNPCPGQIKAKLDQGKALGIKGIEDIMIVFRGSLEGYDPVVASFIEAGYPFAGLLQDDRTSDTRCEVWATLMTGPALRAVNLGEKMVDPYDPTKSDPNADYALARRYPFEIDGMDFAIEAAAYTGAENIYTPTMKLADGSSYRGPVAFSTIPANRRAFPESDVKGVFQIILENMAREDRRFEIDRLLKDRGITPAEMERLAVMKVDGAMERMVPTKKVFALMRWMSERWRLIEKGERPYADMELTQAIKDHMKTNSFELNMLEKKLREGEEERERIVFSREEADQPEPVRFGRVMPRDATRRY